MLFKIKDIEVACIEGIDPSDYPDMVDAFISEAYDLKTGKSLSDQELNLLTDKYSDLVQECARELCF